MCQEGVPDPAPSSCGVHTGQLECVHELYHRVRDTCATPVGISPHARLHRPYVSKTPGSPFTSLQRHEQEHRGHHALHGHLDHGPGLRLCLWLFHVRLPWIAPQS